MGWLVHPVNRREPVCPRHISLILFEPVSSHESVRQSNAEATKPPRLTIVVPTFKEVESLPHLIDRVATLRAGRGIDIEMLIMDDDSNDGSLELVEARPEKWVQIIVRKSARGLSPSVLDGLERGTGDFLVCMDADLSHPPEAVPGMLQKLEEGADFVVGSRYVKGGTTSDDWGFLRWLNSRVATLLARPLTNVRDPMSGFFALRRSKFREGRDFNPVGYKIGLELIVKCGCERVVEVPIHFEDRRFGKSKLTFKQQLLYLQHLRRLYTFKYGIWTQFIQFLVVGALGTVVNLVTLTILLGLALPTKPAMGIAIFASMCFNFVLNRRFSFSGSRGTSWRRQFVSFVAASSLGAIINYVSALFALAHVRTLPPQGGALIGIAVGTAFNFVASRYLVFRTSHIRNRRE
jgi:dolichol-phosphate mannosyltransferase